LFHFDAYFITLSQLHADHRLGIRLVHGHSTLAAIPFNSHFVDVEETLASITRNDSILNLPSRAECCDEGSRQSEQEEKPVSKIASIS